VFTEVSYVSGQKTIASELMQLLEPKLWADEDRCALIAASLLSSLGVPRPTVAELRSGKNTVADFSGSFITALLQRLAYPWACSFPSVLSRRIKAYSEKGRPLIMR
jgi:hypothetical protein